MDPEIHMKLALDLARTAEGQPSPHPLVRDVCIKDEYISNVRLKAGYLHAHIQALNIAGMDHYPALERCSRTQKTAFCVNSGAKHVFIASKDPNPSVTGKGIGLLRGAGIKVVTGLFLEEAEQLNRAFYHCITNGTFCVILTAAVIPDGRLAKQYGNSKWIQSVDNDVHPLSLPHEIILAVVESELHILPFLTTRLPHGGKNPKHIILHWRTPKTAYVAKDNAMQTSFIKKDSFQTTSTSFFVIEDLLDEVFTHLAESSSRAYFIYSKAGLVNGHSASNKQALRKIAAKENPLHIHSRKEAA